MSYPKDIITSSKKDLDVYLSDYFEFRNEAKIFTNSTSFLPRQILSGTLISYDTYSKVLTSPYDTIYVTLSFAGLGGVKKGDKVSIKLPEELGSFPPPFKFQTKTGIDLGIASVDSDTNEVTLEFLSDMTSNSILGGIVRGRIGIFAKFKKPETIVPGRKFFKFSSAAGTNYRYLYFKNPDPSVPRVRCRSSLYSTASSNISAGNVEVYVPNSSNLTKSIITVSLPHNVSLDFSKLQVVKAKELPAESHNGFTDTDIHGEIVDPSDWSISVVDSTAILELKNSVPQPTNSEITKYIFPLTGVNLFENSINIQMELKDGEKEWIQNDSCGFDRSGKVGSSFTFSIN